MSAVVWKFPMTEQKTEVKLPVGAKIIHVAMQSRYVTLWRKIAKHS